MCMWIYIMFCLSLAVSENNKSQRQFKVAFKKNTQSYSINHANFEELWQLHSKRTNTAATKNHLPNSFVFYLKDDRCHFVHSQEL